MYSIKKLTRFLLFFTAINFIACDNEPLDPALDLDDFGGNTNESGVFKATAGSNNFNAQTVTAELSDSDFGTELNISGLMQNGQSMSIQIVNPTVGTRAASFDEDNLLLFQYTANASIDSFYSSLNAATNTSVGVINITSFNLTTKRISGTFSFTGFNLGDPDNQIAVTQGVFTNILFEDNTSGGNNGGGGGNNAPTFKVDFNNATWSTAQVGAERSQNGIQMAATKPNNGDFLFIIEAAGVGTYPANQAFIAYTPQGSEYGYWSVNTANPNENTGSITISSIDTVNKTITGTFNFKGYWSDDTDDSVSPIQFTNGVFTNVPYVTTADTQDIFTAKVNGNNFNAVDISAIVLGINSQDYIVIGAQDSNLNAMSVGIRENVGVGTYSITGDVGVDLVQATYTFNDQEYQAVSGSVTITSKTATRIKGTFNFNTEGSPPYTITVGNFDVEY